MNGRWEDIPTRLPGDFKEVHLCRAFYRHGIKPLDSTNELRNIYMADFVFRIDNNMVLKNRIGSLESLFEDAATFNRLKYHSNPVVRKMLDKAIVLAELSNNPEQDM